MQPKRSDRLLLDPNGGAWRVRCEPDARVPAVVLLSPIQSQAMSVRFGVRVR
jgi:hypothetical protein